MCAYCRSRTDNRLSRSCLDISVFALWTVRRLRGSKSDISRIFVSTKYVGKYEQPWEPVSLGGKITEQIAEQIIDKILYLRVLETLHVSFSNTYIYTFRKIRNFLISHPILKFIEWIYHWSVKDRDEKFFKISLRFEYDEWISSRSETRSCSCSRMNKYHTSKRGGEFDINKSLKNRKRPKAKYARILAWRL